MAAGMPLRIVTITSRSSNSVAMSPSLVSISFPAIVSRASVSSSTSMEMCDPISSSTSIGIAGLSTAWRSTAPMGSSFCAAPSRDGFPSFGSSVNHTGESMCTFAKSGLHFSRCRPSSLRIARVTFFPRRSCPTIASRRRTRMRFGLPVASISFAMSPSDSRIVIVPLTRFSLRMLLASRRVFR